MKSKFLPIIVTSLIIPTLASAKVGNIVATATKAGKFQILTALAKKARLVSTLESKGPYTVLAPDDMAFKELVKKAPALENFLLTHPAVLKKVLLYHVIAGNVMSSALHNHMKLKTVEGEYVYVTISHGHVYFNHHVEVIAPNVKASNGVIHVLKGVLVPPSLRSAVMKLMHK